MSDFFRGEMPEGYTYETKRDPLGGDKSPLRAGRKRVGTPPVLSVSVPPGQKNPGGTQRQAAEKSERKKWSARLGQDAREA